MRWILLATAVALSGCQAEAPVPFYLAHAGDAGAPVVLPDQDLGDRLRPEAATASSTLKTLEAARAIDGNGASYWASGGYREEEVALTLRFPAKQAFRWARVKTGPLPHGATYKFMVSDDGRTWAPASGRLVNTTWGLQLQEVQGEGRYLRMRLFNHMVAPAPRFTVYELELYGGPATGRTTYEGG